MPTARASIGDCGAVRGRRLCRQARREGEVVSADHQNKVDIGATIARNWYEVQGVDMIIDLPIRRFALAVNVLARDLNKVLVGSGAGTAI